MRLIPVQEHLYMNQQFIVNPDCQESLYSSIEFYKKVGFNPPWICYYVEMEDILIGCAAFVGKPVNGRIEIAYAVFPKYQNKGLGTKIAASLVQYVADTDPSIIVTAKTLPEENYSTRILRNVKFKFLGQVTDEEDGEVWSWEYNHQEQNKDQL